MSIENCSYKNIVITPLVETLQILDISDKEYFGPKYKNYISNSKLKLINPEEGGSPELWKAGLSPSFSDSFYFGNVVHCSVLQPDDFLVVSNVDRPTAKAGFMADELYPIFKEKGIIEIEDIIKASNKISYYKGKMNENRIAELENKYKGYHNDRLQYELDNSNTKELIYLDSYSRYKLSNCLTNINKCKDIQNLLHPVDLFDSPIESYNEATILLDIKCSSPEKETILHLKGKLDNYTLDKSSGIITLNDLKTTGHEVSDFKSESFYRFHYYRQMMLYGWMLYLANKKFEWIKNPTFKVNMLLVSTIPPFDCGIMQVTKKDIDLGTKELSDLLKRVAYLEMFENGDNTAI